jgi:hypothetical protein
MENSVFDEAEIDDTPQIPDRDIKGISPSRDRIQIQSCEFKIDLPSSRCFIVGYSNKLQPTVLLRSTIDGTTLATPLAPHIQPSYYAAIIAAEVLGQVKINGTVGSVAARALELTIDNPRVAGYAFYSSVEGNTLRVSRLLLINSQAYFRNVTSRGKVHIDLSFSSVNSTITPPQI